MPSEPFSPTTNVVQHSDKKKRSVQLGNIWKGFETNPKNYDHDRGGLKCD